MDTIEKIRLISELKKLAILLLAGVAYYVFMIITGIKIPCVFYEVTGFQCPGCGITRMLVAISRLEFEKAFHYNEMLFVTLPLLLFIYAYQEYKYIHTGKRDFSIAVKILLVIETGGLIAFGIIRNII